MKKKPKKDPKLTLLRLIRLANVAYPDGKVFAAFDLIRQGRIGDLGTVGDGLAVFIAIELSETYDERDSDWAKLKHAEDVLSLAKRELDGVCRALVRERWARRDRQTS